MFCFVAKVYSWYRSSYYASSKNIFKNVIYLIPGVKPKVATQIYDKLDEIAIKEQSKCKLGGENSVVLVEMYPDCVNRLSPDTTDQPHAHRILMVADTNVSTYMNYVSCRNLH